jgi:primosomal protein DnaI
MVTMEEQAKIMLSKEMIIQHFEEAMKDREFARFVETFQLNSQKAMKVTSKLLDSFQEMKHCKNCLGLHQCQNSFKGHLSLPKQEEHQILFAFAPCRFQKSFVKMKQEKLARASELDMARMKDIDLTGDKKRIEVIKWIDQFFTEYDFSKDMKGLYLHGSFGSGKTFLIQALFHELKEEKHAKIEVAYFPELLRTLKDDWEVYAHKMDVLQTVDLLLLDDIGAEKVTEWGRDEVLGTILQFRMDHHLPTFFTSNMNLKELEKHLAGNVDMVKSRRIIERIKELAYPMELISENRRK